MSDAIAASDEAMRLTANFSNDSLLMQFIGSANEFKLRIGILRQRLQLLSRESPSDSRNIKIQLLLIDSQDLKARAGKFKAEVDEVGRND